MPTIDPSGKTGNEIIVLETEALKKVCAEQGVSLQVDDGPLLGFKIRMAFSMNKDLAVNFIYPPMEEGETESTYPRSQVILKLKTHVMP